VVGERAALKSAVDREGLVGKIAKGGTKKIISRKAGRQNVDGRDQTGQECKGTMRKKKEPSGDSLDSRAETPPRPGYGISRTS